MEDFDIKELNQEDFLPTGKDLCKAGAAIVQYLRNRAFLTALYGDGRAADIMYRYFCGQTLESIGRDYELSRERIRQLCAKYLRKLINHISYYTKDVLENKADREARHVAVVQRSVVQPQPAQPRTDKRRPWTEEEILKVLELKNSGRDFQKIAEEMNRYTTDVRDHYYWRKHEMRDDCNPPQPIKERSISSPKARKVRPIDLPILPWTEDDEALLKSLRYQGISIRDISLKMNRNSRDVSKKLEELGIKAKLRTVGDLSYQEQKEIVQKYLDGQSIATIGEEHRLRQFDVARVLNYKGYLPDREANVGHPWTEDELKSLQGFIDQDYNVEEISYRLGRDNNEVSFKIDEMSNNSVGDEIL